MLYCEDNEEYKFLFTNFIIGYKEYQDQLIDLFDLFYKWNPFEKYQLSQLRGIYLELIVYQLLKEKYPKDLIYQECYIKIGSYNSHTWDILINLDDYPKFYECKFTPHNLKRKHINEMIGLTKILPTSLIFLVSLKLRKRILDKLFTLKESHETNFTEKLEKINLITIEDFNKNNPF